MMNWQQLRDFRKNLFNKADWPLELKVMCREAAHIACEKLSLSECISIHNGSLTKLVECQTDFDFEDAAAHDALESVVLAVLWLHLRDVTLPFSTEFVEAEVSKTLEFLRG